MEVGRGRKCFTEEHIIGVLRGVDAGVASKSMPTARLPDASYYLWRTSSAGNGDVGREAAEASRHGLRSFKVTVLLYPEAVRSGHPRQALDAASGLRPSYAVFHGR